MKNIFQTRKKGNLLATLFVPSRTICFNFGNPVRTGTTLWNHYIKHINILTYYPINLLSY